MIKIVNFEVRHFSLTFTQRRILQSSCSVKWNYYKVLLLFSRGFFNALYVVFWLCQKLKLPAAQATESLHTTSKALWIFNRWNVFVWYLHGHNSSHIEILSCRFGKCVRLRCRLADSKMSGDVIYNFCLLCLYTELKSGCRKPSLLDPNGEWSMSENHPLCYVN